MELIRFSQEMKLVKSSLTHTFRCQLGLVRDETS